MAEEGNEEPDHNRRLRAALGAGVCLAWILVVAIQVNYSFGFVSAGLIVFAPMLLGMLTSPLALLVACLKPAWRRRWAPRLAGFFLFCLTASLTPGLVTNRQIDRGQSRILQALETYRSQHGWYPPRLAEVSDPLVSREKIRIGWDLRPVRYESSPDGSAFQVQFECPVFIVATYDSRNPGWVHDD